MEPLPRRLLLASRLLFATSGLLLGAGLVVALASVFGSEEFADLLLARLMAEIDPDTLASLPPDFLTPAVVQRAAIALGVGLVLVGVAQLATSIGLRRGARWSYAAAVIGGLFVAFTAGATAVFMLAATSAQPQAAVYLVLASAAMGGIALLYGAIAFLTATGRRDLEERPG